MFDATRAGSADSARQAPRTRPVPRIFISSTAIDLTSYRDKVRDAVLRLENLPIAMETFSALGGAPAPECMRMAPSLASAPAGLFPSGRPFQLLASWAGSAMSMAAPGRARYESVPLGVTTGTFPVLAPAGTVVLISVFWNSKTLGREPQCR